MQQHPPPDTACDAMDSPPYANLITTKSTLGDGLRNNSKFRFFGGSRVSADPHGVISLLNHSVSVIVVERELWKTERKIHFLRLARLQRHPLKSLETPHGLLKAGSQVTDVALHDVRAGTASGIANGGGYANKIASIPPARFSYRESTPRYGHVLIGK